MVVSVYENICVTQIRVRLLIPQYYRQEPVISQLISAYSLVVNITAAMLRENTSKEGCFDLELKGTPPQISSGLTYLESLNLKIVGKANTFGDGWHC
jgi:L-aspartate semialdehyde sulfurtransferase ferredoxin